MDIELFIVYLVMLIAGVILLVFNKDIGTYFSRHSTKVEQYFSVLNPRETALALGLILTVIGFLAALDQLRR